MTKMLRASGLMLALFAVLAAPGSAQDVTGVWAITMNSSQGVMEMNVTLEQDGSDVEGTADFAMADAIYISEGRLEDGQLTFLIDVEMQGSYLTAEAIATVDGDEMQGRISVPEMGETVTFTGKRVGG